MHEVFTRKQVLLSPFRYKNDNKLLFFMESQLRFYCVVSIYNIIPPPYQDEVFVMLDRDQDCFGIFSYEENEIDLILVIII